MDNNNNNNNNNNNSLAVLVEHAICNSVPGNVDSFIRVIAQMIREHLPRNAWQNQLAYYIYRIRNRDDALINWLEAERMIARLDHEAEVSKDLKLQRIRRENELRVQMVKTSMGTCEAITWISCCMCDIQIPSFPVKLCKQKIDGIRCRAPFCDNCSNLFIGKYRFCKPCMKDDPLLMTTLRSHSMYAPEGIGAQSAKASFEETNNMRRGIANI